MIKSSHQNLQKSSALFLRTLKSSFLIFWEFETFSPGDLVLGDALYGSYFLLCALFRQGVDMVFEQMGGRKSTIDFDKGVNLGVNDHLIQLTKPKPEWMTDEEYEQHPQFIVYP